MAAYLYNGPEYLEAYVAAFKGGFAPVNTNYRYGPEEIVYLFDNADAEAVVFHATFAELLDGVRDRLPKVRRWYCVADGTAPVPDWARRLRDGREAAAPTGSRRRGAARPTTSCCSTPAARPGMPKGVMWRQDDLFNVLGAGGNALLGVGAGHVGRRAGVADRPGRAGRWSCCRRARSCTAPASSRRSIAMNLGGTVVTLPSRKFSADELWREVGPHQGQLDRDRRPGLRRARCWRGSTSTPASSTCRACILISSSGVMWSEENKAGLLRHLPQAILFDSLGSSEAVGLGGSMSVSGAAQETAKFVLGEQVAVFTDDGRRVQPGDAEPGLLAITGFIPIGYYKDEVKSAQTFRTFEGGAGACPATGPRSAPTARSTCSAAARCASTPAARRCSPKRSRRC